ncbi:PAS domain-containing hybrid sensor histidine kinase/response regulator [Lutibacter maritimus]|nr:PAS domain-containing hybrid sensor histidine kinase/response regulator [Lutibacter maritimus]
MKTQPTYEELQIQLSELQKLYNNLQLEFDLQIKQNEKRTKELLKAKEHAEENEKRFKLLYDNAPLSYQSLDNTTRIIDVNNTWLETMGYEREEVIGRYFREFMTPKSAELIKERFPTFIKNGEIHNYEFEMVRKDGTHFMVSYEGKIGCDEFGQFHHTHCIFSDITHRKQVEEKLNEANEFNQQVINSAQEGFVVYNLNKKYIGWNPYMEELTGIKAADVLGKNPTKVFPFLEGSGILANVEKALKGLKTDIVETSFNITTTNKKGWVVDRIAPLYNHKGKIIGAISTVNDITAQKIAALELVKAKEKAEQSEKYLYTIINNIADPVFVKDDESRMLVVNDAFCKLFQCSKNDVIGKTLAEDVSLEERKNFLKIDKQVLMSGIESINEEPFTLGDNETRTLLTSKKRFINDNGDKFLVGVSHDITSLKIIENDLKIAKEKAEQSDQLKSAFLANMSHEIRTPMNGILGFSELLKNPELSGEKQQQYIHVIEKSGARMLNIINDIIDISKIESGLIELDLKELNINEQLEDIYTFFKPEVEKKSVQFLCNKPLPLEAAIIKTDKEKMYAILTNLVKNAVKFTDKGCIEFGYLIKNEGKNSVLEFYVKDTGIGISKNRLDAIFERFIQADITDKMAHQGAGLGLAISKAYVKMLGGKIWVSSEQKTGSTFYFTIPFKTKDTITNTATELKGIKLNTTNSSEKLKILIVEDDEASDMLLSIAIKDLAKEIIHAKNGIEAVEACKKHEDIDIILMDIQMPVMDGYEATKQIRKFNKKVQIIAQTAFALEGDMEKVMAVGCNNYITKPIKVSELKQMIK